MEIFEEDDEDLESICTLPLAEMIKNELENPNRPTSINTFNQALDEILGKGVECGYVTEIYGSKAVGKTTLCLQLCVNVQLPTSIGNGLDGEAIFIDTEGSFSRTRLNEIVQGLVDYLSNSNVDLTVESILNGIHVMPCNSLEELQRIMSGLTRYIKENTKVKLLVLDSLSFLYYSESSMVQFGYSRVTSLYSVAQELYRLMNKFNIAIVVTNNTTTRFRDEGESYEGPYLGPTWFHIPHFRVELFCDSRGRYARLHKTSKAFPERSTIEYKILTEGFR